MQDDEELCLCFHVTKRKVVQYIRAEQPKFASQLSECYGAGTGCGWCRPFLQRLLEQADPRSVEPPESEAYRNDRRAYRAARRRDRSEPSPPDQDQ